MDEDCSQEEECFVTRDSETPTSGLETIGERIQTETRDGWSKRILVGGNEKPPLRGVPTQLTDHETTTPANTPCLILPVANAVEASPEEAIFMRQIEPFLPACVARILELVQIGDDVTETQRSEVKQLIAEFADCFALSLSEVNLIPGAVHKLDIPKGTTFHTKIPQRSFNPDQRAFMVAKVQEMLKGGIICPMHPGEVRCVAPSVLAQKVHENKGLPLDELKHRVNDECVKYGLPAAFDLRPCPPHSDSTPMSTLPKKWRLSQDFGEINKVMSIAPVPQGDIRAKQLRLSGHRSLLCLKVTFAPNSFAYQDIGTSMCSILQQGFTELQFIPTRSPILCSVSKDMDTLAMNECRLELLGDPLSLGILWLGACTTSSLMALARTSLTMVDQQWIRSRKVWRNCDGYWSVCVGKSYPSSPANYRSS